MQLLLLTLCLLCAGTGVISTITGVVQDNRYHRTGHMVYRDTKYFVVSAISFFAALIFFAILLEYSNNF